MIGDERVASTRYRVLVRLDAVCADGWSVELETQSVTVRSLLSPIRRLRELVHDTAREPAADVLFIHRRNYPPPFARRLAAFRLSVIFAFDDALYLPPPSAAQDDAGRERFRRNFELTSDAADLLICGNEEFARQAPEVRPGVLPTSIDCERFTPSAVRPAPEPVVRWVRHGDNLAYTEALAGPLREVGRRHPGLRLVVVADRQPKIEGLRLEFRRWSLTEEVSCFDGMWVSLMPLEDSPWARAKRAFKAIQYMALGMPPVVSRVGMNCDVVSDDENGHSAATPAAWVDALDALLSDPQRRARLGAATRRTVVERFERTAIRSRRPRSSTPISARPGWSRESCAGSLPMWPSSGCGVPGFDVD